LLTKIEEIYSILKRYEIPIQLNSVYRNPRRADGLSRHQYGDAIDLQVFDNNHDGQIDDDWNKMYAALSQTHPSYVEPMSQSGSGHLHLDWRNVSLGCEHEGAVFRASALEEKG
jgi:hypothetical protein